jgi:hypothetical protein
MRPSTLALTLALAFSMVGLAAVTVGSEEATASHLAPSPYYCYVAYDPVTCAHESPITA